MSEHRNQSDSVLFFLIGGVIGAGLALLFAPQSGEETREQLGDMVKKAKSGGERLLREQREAVDEQGRRIRGAFEAGRKAFREGGESGDQG